ncbi:MAG: glycosyl transferase [Chitinophagaceae bacterium]|nr:glycosyl transferase [Chitinophagaceae bacterium]
MTNFCSLFDSNYLTRGLALYESLEKSCPSFHLFVIAFNDDCYHYLKNSGIRHITPISLKEFEDEELLQIKQTRSAAEYCWTCTPSVILFCLKKFNLPSCTYVDADMIFYDDPRLLLDEMGTASILISEHRYSKEYDQSATHGTYCVQFMFFKNDRAGIEALQWWRERCLEWCYSYPEDGKFGDQKYLDDWTARFKGVHVLQHQGGGLAPWNVQQFMFTSDNARIVVTEKKTGKSNPLIFFHFHGLKFYSDHTVSLSGPLYEMDEDVRKLIYFPYIKKLIGIEAQLKNNGVLFNTSGARSPAPSKWNVFMEYLKFFAILVLKGKASPFFLKYYNFKKHHHLYNTNLFK